MEVYNRRLSSSFVAVDEGVHEILLAIKSQCGLQDRHSLFKINFMLRELLNNAVEHGNRFDENKVVHCLVTYEPPVLSIAISDQGEGINVEKTICSDIKRERQRGYPTLLEMGFSIDINQTTVTVKMNL